MTNAKVNYSSKDAGCYVDSARGIYAVDAIVSFAENHGFTRKEDRGEFQVSTCSCRTSDDLSALNHEKPSDCEYGNEIEDEATDYMNDNFPVDGYYWGRSDQSDWGLWEYDENNNPGCLECTPEKMCDLCSYYKSPE